MALLRAAACGGATLATCHPALGAPWQMGVRGFAAAAQTVTDQMLAYAMQQFKAAPDQAIDVLKSGLSMQPGGKGVDAARLLLAQGAVEADRSSWTAALSCATQAQAAVQGQQEEAAALARVRASGLATSTLLAQGRDAEAASQLQQATATSSASAATSTVPSASSLTALALTLSAHHALAQTQHAQRAADQLASTLASSPTPGAAAGAASPAEANQRLSRAQALLALGDFTAGGWPVVGAAPATELYAGAAEEAQGALQGDGGLGNSESGLLAREVHAAALLGSAQLHVQAERWDEAEEVLGRAMSAAEAVSSDKHPRVAPALLLLGTVYSRSARVTFAEGLYREVGKMLKVDPTVPSNSSGGSGKQGAGALVHPSAVALLSWRFHQLLTALPNRGREASAWRLQALDAWTHANLLPTTATTTSTAAGSSGQQKDPEGAGGGAGGTQAAAAAALERVLGHAEHLSGKGAAGAGVLLSLPLRRVLLTRQALVL